MIERYENIEKCRLCDSYQLDTIIAFGDIALANSYPETQSQEEEKFPLTLVRCVSCGHVQILETVNPKILFSNYLYASSTSPALVKHFDGYAKEVISSFNLGKDKQIVEVGSNDGILLNQFRNLGHTGKLIGIDPATNINEIARQKNNLILYNDFFNLNLAHKIKEEHGEADIIVSNNTFAHIDQLDSITWGIQFLLAPDGVFIFENAYLIDTIEGLYFDQVYHEHLQYYAITPLRYYLNKFGLHIFRVEFNKIQGGSFRCYVKHANSNKRRIEESVDFTLVNEKRFGISSNIPYENFVKKIKDLKNECEAFLLDTSAKGKTISCYGCPAKFALFTKFFGLDNKLIKYVVDDSPLKEGRFSPEKKIPIVSREFFLKNPTDYCIISVWNMADAIIEKNKDYTGKFILTMPKFKII